MDISKLHKLKRKDIECKYIGNPIYILDKENNSGKWYICLNIHPMPDHLRSAKEYKLTDKQMMSIHLCGVGDDSYVLFTDINSGVVEAYGYEQ